MKLAIKPEKIDSSDIAIVSKRSIFRRALRASRAKIRMKN